ncbi:2'-5' RNA ligase family protein [Nocardia callitridis]|uniref:2'-5' RNA ligase family protein n=1 Tax=Nocardia callitridis TaxID=648753 RepID=A0ABP9KKM2_9NOCA
MLRLKDHWTRPEGPLGYYWFLTFETSPELNTLVSGSQEAIDYPYYDAAPLASLHLTLDRISNDPTSVGADLESIERSATEVCREFEPFQITVDHLNCFRSAVAFDVTPAQRVRQLRDALRGATLHAFPAASVKRGDTNPHISIAYANVDDIAGDRVVEKMGQVNGKVGAARVTVREATMVLLERRQRSYAWEVIARVPLAG